MRAILCGACGKMGKEVAIAAENSSVEIVCGVDLAPSPMPFPIYTDFESVNEDAEVLIDFSSPRNLEERINFCKARRMGLLAAVTGLSAADEALLSDSSREIPVMQAANFSIGICLMNRLLKIAAQVLSEYDVELIEAHRKGKRDAPSGTALALSKSIASSRGNNEEAIQIHSLRMGSVAGEHTAIFVGEDEILTISHSARSRKLFAVGALKAAEWLNGKPNGLYSPEDFIFPKASD